MAYIPTGGKHISEMEQVTPESTDKIVVERDGESKVGTVGDMLENLNDKVEQLNADLADKADQSEVDQISADLTYKIYYEAVQINESFSSSTTLDECILGMGDRTLFIAPNDRVDWSGMDNGSLVGTAIIFRINQYRVGAIGWRAYNGLTDGQSRLFFGCWDGNSMHGWFELAKADAATTSALNAEAEKMGDV